MGLDSPSRSHEYAHRHCRRPAAAHHPGLARLFERQRRPVPGRVLDLFPALLRPAPAAGLRQGLRGRPGGQFTGPVPHHRLPRHRHLRHGRPVATFRPPRPDVRLDAGGRRPQPPGRRGAGLAAVADLPRPGRPGVGRRSRRRHGLSGRGDRRRAPGQGHRTLYRRHGVRRHDGPRRHGPAAGRRVVAQRHGRHGRPRHHRRHRLFLPAAAVALFRAGPGLELGRPPDAVGAAPAQRRLAAPVRHRLHPDQCLRRPVQLRHLSPGPAAVQTERLADQPDLPDLCPRHVRLVGRRRPGRSLRPPRPVAGRPAADGLRRLDDPVR